MRTAITILVLLLGPGVAQADELARLEAREGEARSERRLGILTVAVSGVGAAAGVFLAHRGFTACDRWRADDPDQDDGYLCEFAGLGYAGLGGLLLLPSLYGLVRGVLDIRSGSRALDQIDRERLDLAVQPVDGGAVGLITGHF